MRARFYEQSKTTQIKRQFVDITSICTEEPFQRQWMNTDYVQNTMKHINSLPFYVADDAKTIVSKFIEYVASIVRVMNVKKMIDEKHSNKKKNDTMHYFLMQAKEAKRSAIQFAIDQKMLVIESLSPTMFQLYKIPQDEKKEERVAEKKDVSYGPAEESIMKRIAEMVQDLPEDYRLTPPTKKEMAAQTQAMKKFLKEIPGVLETSMEIIAPVKLAQTAQPKSPREIIQTVKKKRIVPPVIIGGKPRVVSVIANKRPSKVRMSDVDVRNRYWNMEDPLNKCRTGSRSQIPMDFMKQIVTEFTYEKPQLNERLMKYPFSLAEKTSDGPMLNEDAWSTAQLGDLQPMEDLAPPQAASIKEAVETVSEDEAPPEVVKQPTAYAVTRSQLPSVQTANMYKMKIGDRGGREAFNMLQTIWNELGFTVQQRLNLVLKYTQDVSESVKLDEALSEWNIALSVANNYERNYQDYKRLLRNEVLCRNKEQMMISKRAYETQEEMLRDIGRQLNLKFADDFIYKGVKATELIERRRDKIEALVKEGQERQKSK